MPVRRYAHNVALMLWEGIMSEPPAGYSRIEGTSRSPVPGATRVGSAEPTEQVSVSIRLRRRPGAPPLPDPAQVAALPGGGLSREEFAATYGADPADIARIEAFGREHGLTVEETSIPRRTVVLAGTVAQMSETFGVDLGRYQVGETSYRGREGHVYLPSELTPLVEGIFGLDNRRQAWPMIQRTAAPVLGGPVLGAPALGAPALGSPMQGGPAQNAPALVSQALTPPQVAKLYNFPPGQATSQCIGLLEFSGGYYPADISSWFTNLGLTPPTLVNVGILGQSNSPGTGDDSLEVTLDIDVAGSVAPGARIAVYFAPFTEQGWVEVVGAAVHDALNAPSVISISWGAPENSPDWTQAAMNAVSDTIAEAATVGVTVLAASGDTGSDCGVADGHAHVEYPASDPGLTACGGTQIGNVSAQGSFDEVLWNPSGGGVSDLWAQPPWQSQAGVPVSVNNPAHHGRGVPDVAGNACAASGYRITLGGTTVGPVQGTSLAAPLYAGLIALINASLNRKVGFLNPYLYQQAVVRGAFRDITVTGSNEWPGAPGYPVGFGWDATTGFGGIDGMKLLAALRSQSVRGGIALTGGSGWQTIPVAFTTGSGVWSVTNNSVGQFPGWAAQPGVKAVTGNFKGSGLTGIALLGGSGWTTIPVALSNGDGTWTVTNSPAGQFSDWAAQSGAKVLTGDFGGTGRTGIALTGGSGWNTMPLALSNADGTWTVTNVGPASYSNTEFPDWAAQSGVTAVAGDFSGTGQAVIALVGGAGWQTIPMAFPLAGSGGTWITTNQPVGEFPGWAAQSGVKVVTGDFSGNGRTDIALLGGSGWTTIPIAFSTGNGSWTVTNSPAGQFSDWAAEPGVTVVTGKFSGTGRTGIALLGGPDWTTIPVAFSNGDGTWTVTNSAAGEFSGWAAQSGAKVVTGDFAGTGLTVIALAGGPGWDTIPVAFPVGSGNWSVTNPFVSGFPGWAATQNVSAHGF
jgi:kumamolisin